MNARSRTVATAPEAAAAFRLEDYLPYRLCVTANRVSRLLGQRYAAKFGLSIPEWRVLATLGRFGTTTPSTVGEWTAMDKVKVSRAAASLAARGLLRQQPDPQDGRARLLRLTRKGMAVHNGVVPQAQALERTLSQGLSRTEWQALNRALQRLNAYVQSIEGSDRGEPAD
jgi:DNA-binding MarR family transcriptional regulator